MARMTAAERKETKFSKKLTKMEKKAAFWHQIHLEQMMKAERKVLAKTPGMMELCILRVASDKQAAILLSRGWEVMGHNPVTPAGPPVWVMSISRTALASLTEVEVPK